MVGQALVQHLVISRRRRGHQWHARSAQSINGRAQIVAQHRDMLDSLAVVLHQEFLDLACRLRCFLVERNPDEAVGRGHRFRREPGVVALDVEVAELAEVEELLVKLGPVLHSSAIHVVCEVIDHLEAMPDRMPVHALDPFEVDVVDRATFVEAIDQIQRRAADSPDRGQPQLHRAGRHVHRLRAQLQRALVRDVRVLYPECHSAR